MKTCEQCHLTYPNESSFCFVDGKPLVGLRDTRVGSTLGGRYVIEEVLGEGGMATVYRARHKLVDRPCAVKIMSAALSGDPVVRERFRREAKATQKLTHPNIIEIFDQGDTEDGTSYLVMELLEGEALATPLARGPLAQERALPIMVQVARALARAHDFEVVHRDLKPDNIFLCRRADGSDLVKLLDFGIARSLQDARLTARGEMFGTPHYMAPERITGIDAGAPSDLYAAGIIFFEMLAGQLPFEAADVPHLLLKHLNEAPPPVTPWAPSTPPALAGLILSLMAKAPEQRPVDAHRMHADLVAISQELGVPVPPDPERDEASSRRPAVALAPVALERWVKRTAVFEQMLAHAHEVPPPELLALLEDVKRLVRDLYRLRAESVAAQGDLEAMETRGREGRQRFGAAVDALGIDASRARDEVRRAQSDASSSGEGARVAKAMVVAAHREVLFWEGRSGFQEPLEGLRAAYDTASRAVGTWLVARGTEQRALEDAERCDREVADLEFQIHELRAALAKLEQDVEGEKQRTETRIGDLDAESEALQIELLTLATRFCAPLWRHPELMRLFHELEAGATA